MSDVTMKEIMLLFQCLYVNMVTNSLLLSVLFLSGVWASCMKKADLVITTPQTIEAVSGSCLQIPCTFSPEPEKELSGNVGVWIKNDSRFRQYPANVIYRSSQTANTYPMEITGNLDQKNCTTLFSSLLTSHTDTYFFRIESTGFKATASCGPLQITVRDSPPRPRIEISGAVGVKDLKEKQSVTITCSASTPCPHSPPELTWTLQQNPQNIREQNTDGTFTTKIQETITLSDTHDGLTISCSAGYPVDEGRDVKTAAGEITLSVSYAPRNTSVSVSPSGLVSAGSWVNLTCSSRAKPPISSFTWFRNSTDGAMNVFEGYFYRLNVTDGGDYYCMATNDVGYHTSSVIHLSIGGANLNVSSSSWGGIVGGIILLICALVAIWWFKSKRAASPQTQSRTAEEPTVREAASSAETGDIHYGEINFSRWRSEPSSSSEQDSGKQQDTLYAEVRASKTAGNPEDLYAQVKKK